MTTRTLTYTTHTWADPAAGGLRPGAVHLAEWLVRRYGGQIIGGYNPRPKRGGTSASQHRNGGTIDWRQDDDARRAAALAELEAEQYEIGLQRMHDYAASRAWYCGDAAHGQKALGWHHAEGEGFGEAWATYLHLELNLAAALNTQTIEQRIAPKANMAGLAEIAAMLEAVKRDPVQVDDVRSKAVPFLVWAFSVLDDGRTMPCPGARYSQVHARRVRAFQSLWLADPRAEKWLHDHGHGMIEAYGLFDGPTAQWLWHRALLKLKHG